MCTLVYNSEDKKILITGNIPDDAGVFAPEGVVVISFETESQMVKYINDNKLTYVQSTETGNY